MAENAKTTPEGIIFGNKNVTKDVRQMCKYGESCYQKNPMHHQKFRHPSKDKVKSCDPKSDSKIPDDHKENVSSDSNIDMKINENKTDIDPPASKKLKTSELQEPICDEKVCNKFNYSLTQLLKVQTMLNLLISNL